MNLDCSGGRLHSSTSSTFLSMRFSQPPTLLSLLAFVLSSTHTTSATPLPYDEAILGSDNSSLVERSCINSCGNGGLCCGAQQACLTINGQPNCGDATAAPANTANNVAGNSQWQLYTTTYTETDLLTRTSTYSSYFASVTSQLVATPTTFVAPAVTSIYCDPALQFSPCGGSLCCAPGQVCVYQGQCGAAVNTVSDVSSFLYSSVTNTASAFIRPTSNTVQTITSTGSPTTTVPFGTPTSTSSTAGMAASTTNNGLSGGAIAGIVIGVIAGIILLLLICTFFCFKGLLDGFLALIGLGPKRRRTEETYIEERRSRHGGGGGGGRTWYGAARPNRVERPKKSGLGGVTGVAAGLAGLAVLLGLKRRRDRKEKSEYTGSSYSYSDYTSASE